MTNYPDLRIQDLVGKVSGVSLSNTTKVLMAVDMIADYFGTTSDDLLEGSRGVRKPSSVTVIDCDRAYADLRSKLETEGLGHALAAVRKAGVE